MNTERWQQIDHLFHSVLEHEPGQRAMFLAQACAGDVALRDEVESLISSHEQAESFIETPASDLAAELFASGQSEVVVGQNVGPYKILSLVGAGGMGEVYLAEDTRLSRRIALKLLPQYFTINAERVWRFEQEARAVSALNHPNIVTIHEIGRVDGTHFIVTEFVDGQTLRQRMAETRMSLREALDVAVQVASALDAAHQAGIVHRDVKPENIMVRPDGYVKVLDFGLAKLTERQATTAEAEEATVKTNPGMVMGTVRYMSPEQARGVGVDGRTDVWSLGIVLYEMVTRHVPFEGETTSHVIVSILEEEPPSLASYSQTGPDELERIIDKALRKNREERYQAAGDLMIDLKNLKQELELEARLERSIQPETGGREAARKSEKGAAGATNQGLAAHTVDIAQAHPTSSAEYLVGEIKRHRLSASFALAAVVLIATTIAYFSYFARRAGGDAIDSVAVLPFVNVDNDPNKEYLSEGISDSIINNLTQLPSLKVMSLNSVLRYKGRQTDPQAVGREMNVRAVLMGRMTQRGDDLLISTELVDVRDNHRLWGEQYNRKLSDIITVQSEISRQISEKLRLRLTSAQQQQVAKHYTENTRAYELYSLGKYYLRGQTKEGMQKSIDSFEEAIKIDPNYALAYTGLSRAYFTLGMRGFWLPKDSRQKTEWAALKAVELDDLLPEAHSTLGLVKETLSWDWTGAEKEFQRGLELNPNSADVLGWYSNFLVHYGRPDEAILYLKRATELDRTFGPAFEAYTYLHKRQYDKAIEIQLKAKEGKPDRGNFQLAEAYIGKGMYQEAIAEMQKVIARENSPERWDTFPILAYAYAAAGKRYEALKILNEQNEAAKKGYISPYNFAIIYTGLGDKDRAFEYLNKAYEEHAPVLQHFPSRPMFDPLHSDPRFADLLRRMNLPPERFMKV